jgi:branched-chain amino acid transport system permease protein
MAYAEGKARAVAQLAPPWLVALLPAIVIVVLQQLLLPSTNSDGRYLWGLVVRGLTLGMFSALVAVGMALVYRANRIVNFGAGDLGLVPTALAVDLIMFSGLNYWLALTLGLGAAVVVGGVVELAIIRRFFRAPRLILTVATIGLAQLLAFCSLMLPRLWGEEGLNSSIDSPLSWHKELAPFTFTGDYLVAWVLGPLTMLAVALFLRFSNVGVAVRAAADRADRASLLGIPVGRLHTFVWAIAGVLSFVALYLRASIEGLPLGSAVGLTTLLSALAALMMGRMTHLPSIVASALALGLLEASVRWRDELAVGPLHLDLGSDFVVAPVMAVVILVTLLLRRPGLSRVESDHTSSWQASGLLRPIPRELAGLPEVRHVRLAGLVLGGLALLALPELVGPGSTLKAAAVLVFAIVILSITVLTGWAGQVSLGQMGFVAVGAAFGAKATQEWGLDLALALPLVGLIGAAVAVVVGLPALRLRGLYLAVTSLAFALAATRYFLNPQFFDWVPNDRLEPEPLLGVWDYDSPEGLYRLALGTFLVLVVGVAGIRRSRTGRVLTALRENERAVAAYGVSVVRAKLTAFALSGFLAAVAGVLLVNQQGNFTLGLFPEQDNLVVFTAAVVGGLGSVLGALLGSLFLKGGGWFLPQEWQLFTTSIGVLAVLLVIPGGVGGALFRGRDLYLRWVARRRRLVVPSLLADVAGPTTAVPAATAPATSGSPPVPDDPDPAPRSEPGAEPDADPAVAAGAEQAGGAS